MQTTISKLLFKDNLKIVHQCRYLPLAIVILLTSIWPIRFTHAGQHPSHSIETHMTCEDFGKTARFNPYSVINDVWFVFYNWGRVLNRKYQFLSPTKREREYVMGKVENFSIPVNWTAKVVLMKELESKITSLLVEKGEEGEYWAYDFQYVPKKPRKIKPRVVRIKQTCENTFIGFMDCKSEHVLAMSRITQIPRKKWLQDAAAAIGYKGKRGTSYLYQGHHWMPIGEADEDEYWMIPPVHRKRRESIEESSEEPGEPVNQEDPRVPAMFPKSIKL